jgi:hypothetical protein
MTRYSVMVRSEPAGPQAALSTQTCRCRSGDPFDMQLETSPHFLSALDVPAIPVSHVRAVLAVGSIFSRPHPPPRDRSSLCGDSGTPRTTRPSWPTRAGQYADVALKGPVGGLISSN